ncbi:TetR/AcrR family transcriptional regulator [Xylocopilactobacillus apis]|uniref:TetR family transcriptional regulator n=1 Tax=Xylocopilactobacillus apis TaxID=2932183 RepID=A0AAU9DMF7_9LACO|nr:TetR/AcrR family transcriptional regulator [Xylocopilactobacillus apis]BDR56063.1 TetR family transcriptional regulator [Xylocopilactobacillus apis]
MINKKKDTKKKIIEAAINELREHNYQDLSLRKLSKQVGLTTGAFYKHFSSRDELFEEVTLEISTEISQEIEVDLIDCEPQTAILKYADKLFKLFDDDPNLMNFLFFNPVASQVLIAKKPVFPLLELIQQLIRNLIITKHLKVNEEELFIQLWSFIQGYITLVVNHVTHFDSQFLKRTLNQLLEEPESE